MTSKSKENAERSVSDSRGKDRGIIKVLNITASDKASLIFNNGSGSVALDLVLPRESNDGHGRKKRYQVLCAFGHDGGEFIIRGEKPMGFVRTRHGLLVRARLDVREGNNRWGHIGRERRSSGKLNKSAFSAGARDMARRRTRTS